MKTHIEEIRAKCILANPEIVELKFGCKFIDLESTQTMIYLNETRSGATFAFSETLGNDCYEDDFRFEDDTKITIIGRDIRLADVLCLPDTEKMKNATDTENAIECFNFLMMWNLKKDRLEDQSPECIKFIHNLICK